MSGSKVVVIAHGLSEIMFCEYVAKVTRVDVCIFARDGGRRAIQINGIQDVLTDYPSDSFASLRRAFPRLEYVLQINRKSFSEDRSVMPRLAIFTILDTDDSPQHVRSYMSGNLTRVGPMGDRVQPVYNIRNRTKCSTGTGRT